MGRPKMIRLGELVHKPDEKSWRELQDESVAEVIEAKRPHVTGKTPNHALYLKALESSTVILVTGPAGTGKTTIACGKAIEMLYAGRVKKLVMSRPLVPCGEDTGFLPGALEEKIAPYMRPMMDAMLRYIDGKELAKLIENEIVEFVPLAFMQGRTFHDAFVILDEAQNASDEQIHMFLTRFGQNAKVVVNGSVKQTNIARVGENPLIKAINKFEQRTDFHLKPMSVIRLGREDIVRHPFIQWIDETLADDFEKEIASTGQQADDECSIICPNCDNSICYDADPDYIKCCVCSSLVDLYGSDGQFDPEVVDDPIPYLDVQATYVKR